MVTREQAEGLARGVIDRHFKMGEVIKSFRDPENADVTGEILEMWKDSEDVAIRTLYNKIFKIYLEHNYRRS